MRDLYLKTANKNAERRRQHLNIDIKQEMVKAKFEQSKVFN